MIINSILIFADKIITWLTRNRSVGVYLLRGGISLIMAAVGLDIAFQFFKKTKDDIWSISVGTGKGTPAWLTIIFSLLGIILVLVGAFILIVEYRRETRNRLIVIELRGLHASPDTSALERVLTSFRGRRYHVLIDFRPQDDSRVNPNLILHKIFPMKSLVQGNAGGADVRDVQVAMGGLAAVPALFLAGVIMDDETNILLYDWDRNRRDWRTLDGIDDLVRFESPIILPLINESKEALLVVEASYKINKSDLSAVFSESIPIVNLSLRQPLADKFWSSDKQSALATEFRESIQKLQNIGFEKIHLILAAPASLSIRFGTCYDPRLLPQVIVYQYEKELNNPYPWGIKMPTAGAEAQIVYS